MSLLTNIIGAFVGAIAHAIHPDKPRLWGFDEIELPTDLSTDQVAAHLDGIAATDPALKRWRHSVVDLLKIAYHDLPGPERDGKASFEARRQLALELGRSSYAGSPDDNTWLHGEVMKAIRQRGIPLPDAT